MKAAFLSGIIFIFTASAFAEISPADRSFAAKAAQINLAEIKMGELALKKGVKNSIKDFGIKLTRDHTDANKELNSIAQEKNISLPGEPSAEQKEHYAMLEKLNGEEFDKSFAQHMVDGHKKAIKLFEEQEKSGTDSDLKKHLQTTLPVLREHLNRAQTILETN